MGREVLECGFISLQVSIPSAADLEEVSLDFVFSAAFLVIDSLQPALSGRLGSFGNSGTPPFISGFDSLAFRLERCICCSDFREEPRVFFFACCLEAAAEFRDLTRKLLVQLLLSGGEIANSIFKTAQEFECPG
ncbi:MAG TPA: hypothetical protein VJW76_08000, partial [Verrucomicrobiae bacterium]|nr:hypothetical protein [Verrucomicrobiae bacterium]